MDVGAWLKNLGLGQYEAAFRDNAIDRDILPRLTADDLKEVGVATVGHRRKLLDAIATLGPAEPKSAPETTPSGEPRPPNSSQSTPASPQKFADLAAERRPMTVMFCDLVGSTALAARLDPEDWRCLVGAYLDEASAAVTALGGHVLKKLGDGLMALFGYPQAQENDAERAVRAALAIQRALGQLNARNAKRGAPELQARIGLDAGQVVVDATGEVFGDAPNIAARVQAAAEPGSVLVSRNVQRQVAGLFVAEDTGAHTLKGAPEPVSLYRIDRASGAGRRRGARSLTPFVGREEELNLLMRRWERARAGGGQLALIVGEPGLGKSRLIEEFHARLGETPHTWVEWTASQLLQNTPLHPVIEWGRVRFGDSDVAGGQRLAELESALKQLKIDPDEAIPLIAPLLGIPLPPDRAPQLPPEEMRRRQLAAIVGWITAGARSQAIVLAFEDLQWADPTSIDLMRALGERLAQAPLFIVATARPEFRPPWGMRSHHSVVSLAPLDRVEVLRMISELAARHALATDVVQGVSERAGGVPLFVEEVTRLLLERGDRGGAQAIPPTLQQSLAARLDRLGVAREVAQIGAVLGRDFSYTLLRGVAAVDDRGSGGLSVAALQSATDDRGSVGGVGDPALQSALDRLTEADILFVEGAAPHSTYRFKHALIQDAAYDGLLKSRRQALHRRAAEILRGQSERAAAEPEVIAYHFTQAGLDDLAIEWWGRAGEEALRRSAFQEAIAHLGKAIAMADKAAKGATTSGGAPAASKRRIQLQTDYGQALMWSRGFAAEETKAAFGRARELAAQSENGAERYAVYYAQFMRGLIRGEMNSARDTAETFLREADAEGRGMEAARARSSLGMIGLCQGDLVLARSCLQRALTDHAPEWDIDARRVFGSDAGIVATDYLALATWLSGNVECARGLSEQAVREAQKLGHVATITHACAYRVILEGCREDPAAMRTAAEALLGIAREHNVALYEAYARISLSWARRRLGVSDADATELRQALANYLEQGNRFLAPWFYAFNAELEALAGRVEDALASVDAGLALAEQTGERWTDPLLHRRKGEILLQRNSFDPAPAEEAFRSAIDIARQQGSRSFALRTALSLAKLYQSTRRTADAHAVVAPALEGFWPTPELPEIAEAQALLSRLG